MKQKYIILVLLISIVIPIKSQIDISAGITKYLLETENASNIGLDLSVTVGHINCDFSTNMSSGEENMINVFVINFGYDIILYKRIHIIPFIGYANSYKIYPDTIKNICVGKSEPQINFGISGRYFINNHMGVQLGTSVIEFYKVGLVYKF